MLAIGLLILGIFSRCIIHIPNFTPVIALALFSGAYLNKRYTALMPVVLMIISDFFIGFHDTIIFTWGAMAICSLLGFYLRNNKNAIRIFILSLLSSVLFFLITNFGTWLAGNLYPKTWVGLQDCFVLAVPFFRPTVLSTILYAAVLFGGYEFMAQRVKNTRLGRVLFTV